ncbi:DNA polymerase III subunit delta' [Nautilia sp.]
MSKIIITDDFERVLKEIKPDEIVYVAELKVEDVRKIRETAYIATKQKKTIAVAAEKYPAVSQNALLKLLEEPPQNIDFILIAKSKYSLLDTVKSRLMIEKKLYNVVNECGIDISGITNDKILELLRTDMDKSQIKSLIYKIIKEKKLDEEQLEILSDAVKMLELNIDKDAVLALLMLSVKERF